jgi:hypothetical protein
MKRYDRKAERERAILGLEAEECLARLTPNDTDHHIAEVTADYLLAQSGPPYRLSIMHDMNKRREKRDRETAAYFRKSFNDLHYGECLLSYDWTYKNRVGIKTADRDHAHNWLMWAFAFGYSPHFSTDGHRGIAFGQGSVEHIRERIREETGRFSKVAAEHLAEIRKALK